MVAGGALARHAFDAAASWHDHDGFQNLSFQQQQQAPSIASFGSSGGGSSSSSSSSSCSYSTSFTGSPYEGMLAAPAGLSRGHLSDASTLAATGAAGRRLGTTARATAPATGAATSGSPLLRSWFSDEPTLTTMSGSRGRRTSFEGGDGPPSEGDKAKKELAKQEAQKAADEQAEEDKAKHITYVSMDGRAARLKATSNKECKADCNESPTLKDEAAADEGKGVALMSAVSGGEKNIIQQCEAFCDEQVPALCFPEDALVVVQGRGCLTMRELQVGDKVLCPFPQSNSEMGLHFESVIGWLHLDRTAEAEMVEIQHESGKLCLSDDHLLFVRQAGPGPSEVSKATPASEVQAGDRLFSPWLDGSLAKLEVVSLGRRATRGLYAPLVSGGQLFVNNVLVSCYAIPHALRASAVCSGVARWSGDAHFLHRAAHALFLPVRMSSNSNSNKSSSSSSSSSSCLPQKLESGSNSGSNSELESESESELDVGSDADGSISTSASGDDPDLGQTEERKRRKDKQWQQQQMQTHQAQSEQTKKTKEKSNTKRATPEIEQTNEKEGLERLLETVHPYAWVNYVLFSSFLT